MRIGGGCLDQENQKFNSLEEEQRKLAEKRLPPSIDITPYVASPTTHNLEVVTFHYNPVGYRRLRETYYEWLPSIAALQPKCYELVFDDGKPEIDGSIMIRGKRSKNLVWQKEAIMNIALRDAKADYFAWIDHDLVFSDNDWADKAIAMLQSDYVAVQLFNRIVRMDIDRKEIASRPSVMASSDGITGCPGGGWIARTDFLREIGGFELSNIFGGGDQTFHDGIRGKIGPHAKQYSAKMVAKQDRWVANTHRVIGARKVGYVGQTAYHLWHGDIKDRQYATRYEILKAANFDPDADIRIGENGLLEWASDKPEMHRWVKKFFKNRREDG